MKLEELKELLELISERNISELELEDEGVRLKIKKGLPPAELAQVAATNTAPAHAMSAGGPAPASGESASEGGPAESDGLCYVTAPMVGTFYRQPEPGSDPFASEGDTVKKGQVLCIIEAMKLMNEIESEHQGELVKTFVENGQPVQYGDMLFAIRETV